MPVDLIWASFQYARELQIAYVGERSSDKSYCVIFNKYQMLTKDITRNVPESDVVKEIVVIILVTEGGRDDLQRTEHYE